MFITSLMESNRLIKKKSQVAHVWIYTFVKWYGQSTDSENWYDNLQFTLSSLFTKYVLFWVPALLKKENILAMFSVVGTIWFKYIFNFSSFKKFTELVLLSIILSTLCFVIFFSKTLTSKTFFFFQLKFWEEIITFSVTIPQQNDNLRVFWNKTEREGEKY